MYYYRAYFFTLICCSCLVHTSQSVGLHCVFVSSVWLSLMGVIIHREHPEGYFFFVKVKATSPIQYSHNKLRIYRKCHTYSMANSIKWGSADILCPRVKRSRSILQCFARTPLWLIFRIPMWECVHIFTFCQMLNWRH